MMVSVSRTSPAPRRRAASGPVARPRALVVDDGDIQRRVLRRMMEALGFTVDEAPDGLLALEQATRRGYAAVLLDLRLPGMSGQEVARRLRGSGGPSAQARIVAITADSLHGDPVDCGEAGMDGWLLKPVTLEGLEQALAPAGRRPPAAVKREAEMAGTALEGLDWLDREEPGLLDDILGAFARQAELRLGEVREAALRGDRAALEGLAHAFRGVCGVIGAAGLSRLLGQLEALAPGAGLEDILPVLTEANLELGAVLSRIGKRYRER